MQKLTTSKTREIIEDFAQEIAKRKTKGPKPTKTVIDFRNELRDGFERDIYYVPIDLLRYRKDNGRISSDVLNYEKDHGLLNETSKETQKIIRSFLEEKDKEKTKELERSIQHDNQRNPAIITCDGFLINGNRRKMVMEKLLKVFPGDERFKTMKVVILPGKNDEGGEPTLLEIEQIENRYQLQSEAKAEYYDFDRALSMRRKIDVGMSLEEQLRDDPIYKGLDDKRFKDEVRKFQNQYLKPLECIDRYLAYLGRKGLYSTVSTGLGDPEGRWQAFLDYYNSVYQKLCDEKRRLQLNIEETEIGDIEDIAFKIIRKREFPDLPKVHKIMRDLPKWLSDKRSKRELLKLLDIDLKLSEEDCFDKDGNEYSERMKDKIWGQKHATDIIRQVKVAKQLFEHKKERETPITLLEAALKKLNHEDMDTSSIDFSDTKRAMELTKEIINRASDLENELYHHQKNLKKLTQMYKNQ